jgi:DNA recombination protein RmuC
VTTALIILGVVALALLGVCVWLAMQLLSARAASTRAEADARSAIAAREEAERRLHTLDAELRSLRDEYTQRRDEAARLGERLAQMEDRRIEEDKRRAEQEQQFKDAFASLSRDALSQSTRQLLDLAQERFGKQQEVASAELEKRRTAVEALVKPIQETLRKTDEKLQAIEQQRTGAYASLTEQIRAMQESSGALRTETGRLVQALRKPQVRGRYGEIQLERVVELAGMRDYCDFSTQSSARDDDHRLLRPDMVVRLPNERLIVIDAKTNIEAYLDAFEAEDEQSRDGHMDRFARHVLDQAKKLAAKDYTGVLDRSPDFVVMFVPGDQFIDAALQREPSLLDLAAEQRVIIASPSTLIGLLRAVHLGWKEKSLSDNANELFQLGRELHDRAATAMSHASSLGTSIRQAVERYNKMVGSFDNRLMPTLRKFEDAGAKSSKALEQPAQVEVVPRGVNVPAALPAPGGAADGAPDGDAGDD